jgi:putative sigma-54 modulation protein
MRLELTGRHLTISQTTRALVKRRMAHTLRLLNDDVVSAHVVLTRERARIRAEVTVHAWRERFLHGEATGLDVEAAVGAAANKVDRQARKLKGKVRESRRRARATVRTAPAPPIVAPSVPSSPSEPARRPRIVRARRYAVKPMSVDDAAAEIGDGAEAVIVFRNSATDVVTVLYRRQDGHLGLIEPDA